MDRGSLLAQANVIPLNSQAGGQFDPQLQGIAPAQVPQQQGMFKDPIAVKRGKTKALFKNYSDISNFLRLMSEEGIDPTQPDLSADDGGEAYQVYLDMDANVRYAANELAREAEYQDAIQPYLLQNQARYAQGIDPNVDMLSQNPNAVQSLEPTAATESANLRLNTPTYTNADERSFNKAYYDQAVRMIDKAVASGQITAEQGEIQKQILQPNVAQTSYQELVADKKAKTGSKTAKSGGELLKAIVNQTAGNWSDGTFKPQVIGGKRYNVSTKFSGEKIGEQQIIKKDKLGNEIPTRVDIIIKDWIKDPKTGEIKVRFMDDTVPPVVIDKSKGQDIFNGLVSSNAKYGGTTAVPEIYNYAREQGWLDETNNLIADNLIEKDVSGLSLGESDSDWKNEKKIKLIKENLNKAKEGSIINFRPGGKLVQVEFDKGAYKIANWEQLSDDFKRKTFTEDEIIDLMQEYGYFGEDEPFIRQHGKSTQSPEDARKAALKAKYGVK